MIFVISLCVFFNCIDNLIHNWVVYNENETGLKLKEESFSKILIKDETFYLLGTNNDSDLSKSKSIVYKSNNYCKNWTEVFSDKGNIANGYIALNELNFFEEVYSDNSLNNTSLSLINRDSVIHSFKINSSVKGVFIDNYGKGAVVINNSFLAKDNAVFWTTDNFKSYDSIYFGKSIKKSHFFNGKVYLLTYELTRKNYEVKEKNEIYIIDRNGNRDSLQEKYNIDDFVVDINGILLLGVQEEKVALDYLLENGEVRTMSFSREKNLTPEKVYKYNNFIAVLVSKINESALGGFGGTQYQLYLSFDDGQTFKKETLPISDFVGPITFYKDEKIIVYSGAGRISVCNLKS